jgi:threonine synthase
MMMSETFLGYRCSLCSTTFTPSEVTYTCPKDGGNLEVILSYDTIRKHYSPHSLSASGIPSLWQFLPLLPLREIIGQNTSLSAVGQTPVYHPSQLALKVGLPNLWVKDESRNPTASFKDRASAIVVARAAEIKAEVVVTASTGNAGAALAGMSAAVGQKAVIFAPRTAPPAKVVQLLVYGAKVILVDGSYDEAFDLTIQAAQEFGWYCRNTGYNPFTLEGKKTAAFEIWAWWQQNLHWPALQKPLAIFVSVGDGNIISGLYKGFKDLQELGWLSQMPRLFGVQAEGSAAVARAFENKTESIVPVQAKTLADSISVDLPRDGIRAVRAVRDTLGSYIVVSDEEILQAIPELGSVGIFSEPAGAAGYAGFLKAMTNGLINPDDPVMVINTGSGLKDIQAAMKSVPQPVIIEPDLRHLKSLTL